MRMNISYLVRRRCNIVWRSQVLCSSTRVPVQEFCKRCGDGRQSMRICAINEIAKYLSKLWRQRGGVRKHLPEWEYQYRKIHHQSKKSTAYAYYIWSLNNPCAVGWANVEPGRFFLGSRVGWTTPRALTNLSGRSTLPSLVNIMK